MKVVRILIVLVVMGAILGGVFGFISYRDKMIGEYFAANAHPELTVTAEPARAEEWSSAVESVGTLEAIQGVDVSSSVAGIVKRIEFQSGRTVKAGQPLIYLDSEIEEGDLRSSEAQLELARLSLNRTRSLAATQTASGAALDQAVSNLRVSEAQVAGLRAKLAKRTILAPFGGVAGISQVDPGEYLQPGAAIVSLQDLSSMLSNFNVSQKDLADMEVGRELRMTTDAWPGRVFAGTISAIEPRVDANTGMVAVQGRFANPDGALRPGMFASIKIVRPARRRVVTVPGTAIAYSLHGDSVFLVKTATADGKEVKESERVVVTVGERVGDRVAIAKGLQAGDLVVTTGQVKLQNGSRLKVVADAAPQAPAQPSRY